MAHILLIEDDIHLANLMVRWLAPHEVVVCTDARSATEKATWRDWDLVVSDVELGNGDGLDLLAVRGAATPTLFVTAHAKLDVAVRALDLSAAGLLQKPLQRATFRAKVDQVLGAARAKRPTVLAIGAHPDDVELGVGGILAGHAAAGDRVEILTLSKGAKGGDVEARCAEASHAARLLGARLHMADLPDTRMESGPATIDAIAAVVRAVQPTIVYTHSANDRHQDHRAVHAATLVATRSVDAVFAYQSPSSTVDFRPTRFVGIGQRLDTKLAAIDAYGSQGQRGYMSRQAIEASAYFWGRFANHEPVEPLEVVREAITVRAAG